MTTDPDEVDWPKLLRYPDWLEGGEGVRYEQIEREVRGYKCSVLIGHRADGSEFTAAIFGPVILLGPDVDE